MYFIVALIYSCNVNNKDEKKSFSNVLSVEDFTNLMIDIQLIEGHLNTNRVDQVFMVDSSKRYYKEIFNKHNITYTDYKENLKFYTSKPKTLEEVYKKVEEKLVVKERLYKDVVVNKPAISPISKNKLFNILLNDTSKVNFILDTTFSYKEIRDSLFLYYNDSVLKEFKTNYLSFQQSFNVTTHTKPLFNFFKNDLEKKCIIKITKSKTN